MQGGIWGVHSGGVWARARGKRVRFQTAAGVSAPERIHRVGVSVFPVTPVNQAAWFSSRGGLLASPAIAVDSPASRNSPWLGAAVECGRGGTHEEVGAATSPFIPRGAHRGAHPSTPAAAASFSPGAGAEGGQGSACDRSGFRPTFPEECGGFVPGGPSLPCAPRSAGKGPEPRAHFSSFMANASEHQSRRLNYSWACKQGRGVSGAR